jgi:hypothetical protein
MRKVKIGFGLLAAIIGIGSSAFTVKPSNYVKQMAYYWYTLANSSSGWLGRQSTIATETSFLPSLPGNAGSTFNTMASGGTAYELGFSSGGTAVSGSGAEVEIYKH